jgi:dienelactone hydrolase
MLFDCVEGLNVVGSSVTLRPRHEEPATMQSTPLPARRSTALPAMLAIAMFAMLLGAAPSQANAAAVAPAGRFVTTQVPDSPAGRQLGWFIEASARLPIGAAELRAHFTKSFLAAPGGSPTELNDALREGIDASGVTLLGLTLAQPDRLIAILTGRGGLELALVLTTNRAGLIEFASLQAVVQAPVTLPAPSGPRTVGTDVVALVDHARRGRRLILTRWYPAATKATSRPLATYAGPLLSSALGLPRVRVHARLGAMARPGRLPTVLFSPGFGTPRVIYQALAEDLASHGYLVVAVDHTGEAPVELPGGRLDLPGAQPRHPIAAATATRLADMRLVLRRLNTIAGGPRADRRRVAAIGHSLGGSTAAALMRAEPSIRAGVDMDGSIFGAARKHGVPRAFLVMLGGRQADPTIRGLLGHSRGPRLALTFAGFEHLSFSDLPVVAPAGSDVGRKPSARDIVVQRAYLRAFLDRYVLRRRSPLLDGPSRRFPQVRFAYRAGRR